MFINSHSIPDVIIKRQLKSAGFI